MPLLKNTLLIISLFLVAACIKPQQYPVVPQLTYKDFEIKDSFDLLQNHIKLCRLTLYVVDGDGDLGLQPDDTFGIHHPDSVHYHDLFITLMQKKHGVYDTIKLDIDHNYRTPYFEPKGQNKTMKADVVVKFEYPYALFKFDTLRYDFFIYDRALNRSTTEHTPDLPVGN